MLFKAILLAFALSEGADVATTHSAFGRGCVEANPIFGTNPPIGRIVAVKVPVTLFVGWMGVKAHRRKPTLATVAIAGVSVFNFAVSAHNMGCGR